MPNIFKAFMYDLRTDGFVYATKRVMCQLNPYAQLRDARAWMEDQRETIEALAQEVVQLEAQLEATKYVFVPGSDYPEHVTPRSWRYAYCPPPTPTLDEWMEGADLSVPAGEYEPREATPVVMLDEWLAWAAMNDSDPVVMAWVDQVPHPLLDEWLDPDTREQSIQAAKLLHPLLETKRPRKNKNR